jgi:hypothetical protein
MESHDSEGQSEPLVIGGKTVDQLIEEHLVTCDQCRNATRHGAPRHLGNRSAHCGTYWQLQLDRANYEGKVNNVVAHTEHGDEAPVIGRLE